MVHHILVVISSNSLEYVEEDENISLVYSDIGSSPSVSSISWDSSIFGPPISLDSE